MIWNIIAWILVGALAGWIAGKIMKSKRSLGRNIIVGVVGSVLGGWIAGLLGINSNVFSIPGVLIAIGGACLLIWLARLITGKK